METENLQLATIATGDTRQCGARGLPKPGGVVVMGADYRGLGVVRSLGRRRIPVVLLQRGEHKLAAWSRYVARVVHWPEDTDDAGFLLRLAETEKLHGWLLVPTADETVGLVARSYDALASCYTLTTPPWETLEQVCNKLSLYKLAHSLGIDQPWTFCPRNSQELESLDCQFPVILKPALREASNPFTSEKAWLVNDRQELLARYQEATRFLPAELVMVQEIVPGGGEAQFSYAALWCEGRELASVVARRTRQFPIDFGRSSTFVETVQDPGLRAAATRVLAAARMTGLVEVEFKRDPSGRYRLLDVNPRVWGWHTLGARAGVDFSYLLWLLAQGEPVPQLQAVPGISWMRLGTDIPVALQQLVRGTLSWKAYLRGLFSPQDSPIFAIDDPVPALLDVPLMAYLVAKRAWQKLALIRACFKNIPWGVRSRNHGKV
ncbi:MAG: ATP-grasp domain-containing protein [Candidatus Korobacteraceae bacterium]